MKGRGALSSDTSSSNLVPGRGALSSDTSSSNLVPNNVRLQLIRWHLSGGRGADTVLRTGSTDAVPV
jgi:hypothetical protein